MSKPTKFEEQPSAIAQLCCTYWTRLLLVLVSSKFCHFVLVLCFANHLWCLCRVRVTCDAHSWLPLLRLLLKRREIALRIHKFYLPKDRSPQWNSDPPPISCVFAACCLLLLLCLLKATEVTKSVRKIIKKMPSFWGVWVCMMFQIIGSGAEEKNIVTPGP